MSSITLVTLPLSHYCERGRWALDYAGISYRESRHLQGFHRFALQRIGANRTVPALVTDTEVIGDSDGIVAYADRQLEPRKKLRPWMAESIEAQFERELAHSFGVEIRLWVYHMLLPHGSLLLRYNNQGAPWWQSLALRLAYMPMSKYLRTYLTINDTTAQHASQRVKATFDAVATFLRDKPYLAGDRFSALDLTFASLAAVLLMPANYGVSLPNVDELPPLMAEKVAEYRQHSAGVHALRVYRNDRRNPATSRSLSA